MNPNIRRPDLIGVTEIGELTAKVQSALEDIIGTIEAPRDAIRYDLRTMRWDEDGNAKSVQTKVPSPRMVVARAVLHQRTADVVATGSVSFVVTGRDIQTGDTTISVMDISGLTTGTRYEVTLFIVGEV